MLQTTNMCQFCDKTISFNNCFY